MTRYVTLLRFTEQGMKNLNQSTTRAAAFEKAAAKAGVQIEAQYWTTGSYDGVLIFSAREETDAMRCLAALAAAANVRADALRAFTADEFDKNAGFALR
jgi:uncharacterized protein with GYD domain